MSHGTYFSIFDHDLRLQWHISDMKYVLQANGSTGLKLLKPLL